MAADKHAPAAGQPCGCCIAESSSDVASLLFAVIAKSIARRPLKMPRLTEVKGLAPEEDGIRTGNLY